MSPRRAWTRGAAAVLTGGLLLLGAAASGTEDPTFPGLPLKQGAQWTGVATTGLGSVVRAAQYFRLSDTGFAVDVKATVNPNVPPDPCQPAGNQTDTVNRLFALSPPGSAHKYGDFPPLTVTTLAFGSVPVEADVQISQLRDTEGLPVPIVALQSDYNCRDGLGRKYLDATAKGQVDVRLAAVRVDGVAVDVGPRCTTSQPADLSLLGKGFRSLDTTIVKPPLPTTTYYVATTGGLLNGFLDVPSFHGCVSPSGEDLSALFTGLVSGPKNPVQVRQSSIGNCFPQTNPNGTPIRCVYPPEIPYPPRTD